MVKPTPYQILTGVSSRDASSGHTIKHLLNHHVYPIFLRISNASNVSQTPRDSNGLQLTVYYLFEICCIASSLFYFKYFESDEDEVQRPFAAISASALALFPEYAGANRLVFDIISMAMWVPIVLVAISLAWSIYVRAMRCDVTAGRRIISKQVPLHEIISSYIK